MLLDGMLKESGTVLKLQALIRGVTVRPSASVQLWKTSLVDNINATVNISTYWDMSLTYWAGSHAKGVWR